MSDTQVWLEFLDGNAGAIDVLVTRHGFRVARLAGETQAPLRLVTDFFKTANAYLREHPSFLHWLFLISRREIRFLKTGYLGWDGLFETHPEVMPDCASDFQSEMKRQMKALTDQQLGALKMKFEDGLWFEETAVQMETIFPNKGTFKPANFDWLEEWKEFQAALSHQPEITR